MKYSILLTLSLAATSACFAADRLYSCTGQSSLSEDGVIRVNIIRSNGHLKATLSEGAYNRNTWDTYHVTERSGNYQGTDRDGREFEARIDGNENLLVKAVAPDVRAASGEDELTNIRLSCE